MEGRREATNFFTTLTDFFYPFLLTVKKLDRSPGTVFPQGHLQLTLYYSDDEDSVYLTFLENITYTKS